MSEKQDESLSVHSPYYLHPSENPAIALVSPLLDPTNYNSWSRSSFTTLSAKNKVEFADGCLPRSTSNHRLYAAWKKANNMVVSWLVHLVATSIHQSILWMDNAVDIWKDLKARYSQGDLLRISNLQHKLASIKQGDMNITDYFTKLGTIWDELESYQPNPMCRDNHAVETCYKKNGFPPNFFSNRGGGGRGFGRGGTRGKNTNGKVCTHCGIINHTVDECYKKHGYPPGHKFYKPQGASVNNTIKEEENVSSS